MMRGASAAALRELSDQLGGSRALADAADEGQELFGVAAVLRSQPTLRRLLADASVSSEAKVDLTESVFASAVRDDTLKLLREAVQKRWTSSVDLADAVEHVGIVATVNSAGAAGRGVSDELFAVRQLVASHHELRAAVGDLTRSAEDRTGLLLDILGDTVQDATGRLVAQAVASEATIDNALDRYQDIAAGLQGAQVAVVRTARALDEAEMDRLIQALNTHYGTDVHAHVVVDPDLVGGLRVEIGDDVIDGTMANRLDEARRRLVG